MAIVLAPDAMHAAAFTHAHTPDGPSFLCASIPLDTDDVRALEETVYDNPLLVAPFGRVDILLRSADTMAIPAGLGADAVRTALAAPIMGVDTDTHTVVADAVDENYALAYPVRTAVLNFLRRTFDGASMAHPLTALARYFGQRSILGNSGKLYVNIRPGGLDLLAWAAGGPAALTSVSADTVDDMVYFILAVMQRAGLSTADDQILLCGDAGIRAGLMTQLRRFAASVMPVIMPSAAALLAGPDLQSVPFEILTLIDA